MVHEEMPVHPSRLGEPCAVDADCASGSSCSEAFPGIGSALQTHACTLDCARAPCPEGSTCVDLSFVRRDPPGSPRQMACLPSCTTDADCLGSARAGKCRNVGHDVDGGYVPGSICDPLECHRRGECPSGYACTKYFADACTVDDTGDIVPGGWCQKRP
ncbi:hypothetical protein [Pendulispora albinea]|uniref:Disintegrin domain-containing protein n=1 Tax=Pendulispora albinea TaxID=2741071 RepID=A0ABZ2M7Y6_9BACT